MLVPDLRSAPCAVCLTVMTYARLQSSAKRLLHSELSCEDGMDMLHASDRERNATTAYVKSGDETREEP